jgi:uncharacterized membrane protein YcaP (DUF421 family)
MDKEEIFLSDWKRILFGNAPVEFLLEVLIRSVFIYCFLLIIIRLLGKRMSSQLTITELAVMLTLGAIVSVPMQMPERGILQGVLLLVLILLFERGLTWLIYKNKKIEDLTQGKMSLLIKDGVMQLGEVKKLNISHEQLYAVLRSQEIFHLGQIKRLYQEACGAFTVYKNPSPKPGLPILPKGDKSIQKILKVNNEVMVCGRCGNTTPVQNSSKPCTACHNDHWQQAVS